MRSRAPAGFPLSASTIVRASLAVVPAPGAIDFGDAFLRDFGVVFISPFSSRRMSRDEWQAGAALSSCHFTLGQYDHDVRVILARPHAIEGTSDMSLTGKVAIITGGSQGVGKGIAATLAAEGARVMIAARSPQQNCIPGSRASPETWRYVR